MSEARTTLRIRWQTAIAVLSTLGGLVYPVAAALAVIRTAGQVSDRGPAVDPIIYAPPTLALLSTLVLLPIGVIVGCLTIFEVNAIRHRSRM